MWNAIALQVSDALGRDFRVDKKTAVTGGDTHQAFKVADHHCSLFIKFNDKSTQELFDAEAHALSLLRKEPSLIVPEVVTTGSTAHNAFIALEHLELTDGAPSDWYRLGQSLARLHRDHCQSQYGFDEDNYIGTTVQPNRWQSNWGQFFSEQRLGWQLQLAHENGYRLGDPEQWIKACAKRLQGHKPQPSLLHGDLWHGNIAFVEGNGAIFDPASYYGDRETDLAMTQLFSSLPTDFYHGYDAEWPIDGGYEQRKPIYQLYHLLNHLNLFGGSYLPKCQTLLQELFGDH